MIKRGIVRFLVYLIFGLYFINSALNFITLPSVILIIDRWIILVGGILIILGGINYFRRNKMYY